MTATDQPIDRLLAQPEHIDPDIAKEALELARYCIEGVSTLAKQGVIAAAIQRRVNARPVAVADELGEPTQPTPSLKQRVRDVAKSVYPRLSAVTNVADRLAKYRQKGDVKMLSQVIAAFVATEREDAKREALMCALMCDACSGTGTALSGPCGCGGTGNILDMLTYVRLELAKARDATKDAKREERERFAYAFDDGGRCSFCSMPWADDRLGTKHHGGCPFRALRDDPEEQKP